MAHETLPDVARGDLPAPPASDARGNCPNCGSDGSIQFCPRCGQENPPDHGYTFWSFTTEAWHSYRGRVAMLPSIWALVSKPGVLARDFVEGRRIRHPHPFKIFVACASVCSVVSALTAPADEMIRQFHIQAPELDQAAITSVLPWAVGIAKFVSYCSYTAAMAVVAGLLRTLVPASSRLPLAHVVLPIHVVTVAMLMETLVGAAAVPLGELALWLSVGATVVATPLWFYDAVRHTFSLEPAAAMRLTGVATAVLVPAYICYLLVTILAFMAMFVGAYFVVARDL